jgi:hypothetical protein
VHTVIVLALAVLIASTSSKSNANEIYIIQSGDDFVLDAQQRSKDNYALMYATGDNNNITMYQGMHDDGTIDSDETGGHEAYWVVSGANNTLEGYQTDTNRSGGGGDSHHYANYITGDNNSVDHVQMGKAGHDGFVEIDGDDNFVDLYQRGNGGQKWADVVLTGDGHAVDIDQRGSNSASATVDLTNSGGAYNFTLTQNVTTSADTYSITGSCATTTGCNITVNRNN